jgi:hypothetical protein
MTRSVRVEVTAEHIAAAGVDRMAWAAPVEDAIAALTGQTVMIDGGDGDGCVVTIGQDAWTLVIDLPADVNAWLDARWEERWADAGAEGWHFDLEVPDWVEQLLTSGPVRA